MINVAIPSWSKKHPFDVTATNDKLVIYDKYTKLVTKFVQITSNLRFIIVIRNGFDVCWGTLGTSIFGNSSSVASNTRSRLPSRLSFRFLCLWLYQSLHILKHSEKIEMSFCVPFFSFPKSFFLFFFRGFNIIVIIMSIFFIVFPFLLNFVLFSTLFNHHLLLTDVLYLLKNNFLDLRAFLRSTRLFHKQHYIPAQTQRCLSSEPIWVSQK